MLDWEKLLCSNRRKSKFESGENTNTGKGRVEIERDYDRILFATPTRRMADKTQVFPLDTNDSIRTRLTHSHEVANLARSIGTRIAFEHTEEVFGKIDSDLQVQRNIPSLLAAIGLSHDLGNPPFGHQGEKAICQWFSENNKSKFENNCHQDFLNFDGNAQTFRLLTKLQILNDSYGLNLTYATLAAILKYPSFHDSDEKNSYGKWGVFESEREVAEDVWQETGLEEGRRHPLTYIMEACDDIAYSVLDAEDTVKKGYASFNDLMDHLRSQANGDTVIDTVIQKSLEKNEEYKKEKLSSRELNDVSMQMFRVFSIYELVSACSQSFLDDIDIMMNGKIPADFKLIKASKASSLCKSLKEFDRLHGFHNKEVLRLELEGSNYIKSMMDMLWGAINMKDRDSSPFENYAFSRISENYRRVYDRSNKSLYAKCQLLCDAVSGMTDSYLITLHDELRPLYVGYRSNR